MNEIAVPNNKNIYGRWASMVSTNLQSGIKKVINTNTVTSILVAIKCQEGPSESVR
jgi:hypothetical protein